MKKARVVAFSGIISALSVVILLLGTLIQVMDITLAVVASFLLLVTFEEMRYKALYVYGVTLTLGFLVCFSYPLVVIEYAIFGLFPIIRSLTDKLGVVLGNIIKIGYALITSLGTVLLMKFALPGMAEQIADQTGRLTEAQMEIIFYAVYFVANMLIFLLFDIALKKFSLLYRNKLRHQLRIDKFFD
ncbi:MAG: hypothetical protein IJ309_00385 [Clostridia bacterium]|nr:hypothetical protein [Clostridia bacterium]